MTGDDKLANAVRGALTDLGTRNIREVKMFGGIGFMLNGVGDRIRANASSQALATFSWYAAANSSRVITRACCVRHRTGRHPQNRSRARRDLLIPA
jgi:hypothetical protein